MPCMPAVPEASVEHAVMDIDALPPENPPADMRDMLTLAAPLTTLVASAWTDISPMVRSDLPPLRPEEDQTSPVLVVMVTSA